MTQKKDQTPEEEARERRAGSDRRTRHIPPDDKGLIHADGYSGPDRRDGVDRRRQEKIRRERVWQAKMAFLNSTTLSMVFIFVAVVYAAYFLLAPEIARMNKESARVRQMEERMAQLQRNVQVMQAEKAKPSSVGGTLNRTIARIENAAGNVPATAAALAEAATGGGATGAEQMAQLISGMQVLERTPQGRAAKTAAVARLQTLLAASGDSREDINAAVALARNSDPTLGVLLRDVEPENLGAAAMLLALNELRGNIDRRRPFAGDLLLVRKFAGKDPELQEALTRLAPYAESGVLSREGLQREFRGIASDIVMAKLEGRELSVKEAALKRLGKYVKVRRTGETGDGVDATVARAQRLLDQGDVPAAIAELQKLEGPPAAAAAPWLQQATGQVAADASSDMLTQAIFHMFSPAAGGFSVDGLISALRGSLPGAASMQGGGASPYLSPSMQNNAR